MGALYPALNISVPSAGRRILPKLTEDTSMRIGVIRKAIGQVKLCMMISISGMIEHFPTILKILSLLSMNNSYWKAQTI